MIDGSLTQNLASLLKSPDFANVQLGIALAKSQKDELVNDEFGRLLARAADFLKWGLNTARKWEVFMDAPYILVGKPKSFRGGGYQLHPDDNYEFGDCFAFEGKIYYFPTHNPYRSNSGWGILRDEVLPFENEIEDFFEKKVLRTYLDTGVSFAFEKTDDLGKMETYGLYAPSSQIFRVYDEKGSREREADELVGKRNFTIVNDKGESFAVKFAEWYANPTKPLLWVDAEKWFEVIGSW
jgi:hypothetical protein